MAAERAPGGASVAAREVNNAKTPRSKGAAKDFEQERVENTEEERPCPKCARSVDCTVILGIENLSFVICFAALRPCALALKSVAGAWEGGVRISTTWKATAARQARQRRRPGE